VVEYGLLQGVPAGRWTLLIHCNMEDALAESVSSFLSPFFAQVPTIELSSFAQRFSIRVERAADDGSEACQLQSIYHRRSSLITKFFMLGLQIIAGKAQ